MAEARLWHEEQKTQDWTEYYVLIVDEEKTIPFILKHNSSTKEVIAEPYSPQDYGYTIHDFCDHENGYCVEETEAFQTEQWIDTKLSLAMDNLRQLEQQVKQQHIVERLAEEE